MSSFRCSGALLLGTDELPKNLTLYGLVLYTVKTHLTVITSMYRKVIPGENYDEAEILTFHGKPAIPYQPNIDRTGDCPEKS